MEALDTLRWDSHGLVTVVVQDRHTGEVRMVAHANRAALDATLATGFAHFYSRSRQQLWKKGESSGHVIAVADIWTDCDGDALVYLSEPHGPSCHTERATCFFRRVTAEGIEHTDQEARPVLSALDQELIQRKAATGTRSYTRKLLDGGAAAVNAKIVEEAGELAQAIERESAERVASEAADVVYHLMVGLLLRDLGLRDVASVLGRRFGVSGLLEKARRNASDPGSSA